MTRRSRSDAGVSLVELLVVMAITGLIGALASGLLVSVFRDSTGTRARVADVEQVRVGMNAMTKTIRTAIAPAAFGATCPGCDAAFTVAGEREVVVFANLGTDRRPTKVAYELRDDQDADTVSLVETSQPADAPSGPITYADCSVGSAGCGKVERVLVRGIAEPTAPVFRYLDAAGVPTGLLELISAVEIELPVRTPTVFADATSTSRNKVFLPNSAIGR